MGKLGKREPSLLMKRAQSTGEKTENLASLLRQAKGLLPTGVKAPVDHISNMYADVARSKLPTEINFVITLHVHSTL